MKRSRILLVALPFVGCTGPTEVPTGPDEPVLFLVQRGPPASSLEALYQGPVIIDQEGCLRLGSQPGQHTVVWPFGFGLARDQASLIVLDPAGREVARVGANVRMGGGETPTVPGAAVLTEDMRRAAEARCPGPFWLAGEVGPPSPR